MSSISLGGGVVTARLINLYLKNSGKGWTARVFPIYTIAIYTQTFLPSVAVFPMNLCVVTNRFPDIRSVKAFYISSYSFFD